MFTLWMRDCKISMTKTARHIQPDGLCRVGVDRRHRLPAPYTKMASKAEGRMNLSALQQRDPYITDIVDTASQVALYSFSSKTNEWVSNSLKAVMSLQNTMCRASSDR